MDTQKQKGAQNAIDVQPKITEKSWNKELEKAVRDKWNSDKIYGFDINSKKEVFSIDTPPPYPSGRPWHIGAAAHYSQIDMIARTARMLGHEVFFPIGIDRNGLPVELYTEKKYHIRLQDVTREKFISLCMTALDDLEAYMIEIMKLMGMSSDFGNYYRTDSEQYRTLTQNSFIELWNKGMIYEDTRPNNFCVDCRTTIADAEIIYRDMPTQLVHVKWNVKEGGEIIVATTRPELLCSCQVVMVNPGDQRYKNLIGKHAIIPLFKREVKIMAHPSVQMDFGSGIVMACSYGDYDDVRIFRELGLAEIIAINTEGRMTDRAGNYAGMKIAEARKSIIEDLKNAGLIEKTESINHRTPTCERSKTPVEIIPMKEYYLKQLNFKEDMAKMAKKLKFHPEGHRQILMDWINSVTIDWPISRRRYYGTEIPIWYCKKCGKTYVPEPGRYYQPWKTQPGVKCSCGSSEFKGEERTFDTWMDSSISPLFISRYRQDDKFFKKTYPNAIRPQAKDIIRTWLYYTLLRCYQLTGKPAWEHAWIMGYGVDEKGEKMSKSKGNVIDPLPVLEKYGADSFRYWNAAESSLGSDLRCSEERIMSGSKFLTKLWNVARFISSFPCNEKGAGNELDKWILSELDKLVAECVKGYNDFNFFVPATKIRDFVWNIFAPYYIELSKARAYSGDSSAHYTLHQCMKIILKLLAPITPHISDYIWRELYSKKSIHTEKFPEQAGITSQINTEELISLNSVIWKEKKEKSLSLKAEVAELTMPEKFRPVERELAATHHIKKITYGDGIKIII